MARTAWLTRNDDGFDSIAWAYEVHLKRKDPGIYNSALLHGNEDAPNLIEFYRKADPLVTDKPYKWRPTRGNPGINGNGWTPIHAIRFNEDGSVSLMGAHTNPAKLGTGERFRALTKQLRAKGAYSPGGLARYIGIQKYGAKKFAELQAKGRARARRRRRS